MPLFKPVSAASVRRGTAAFEFAKTTQQSTFSETAMF
jgi:hypothetical protein